MPGKNSQFSEDISLRDKILGAFTRQPKNNDLYPRCSHDERDKKKINQRKYHAWMQKIINI